MEEQEKEKKIKVYQRKRRRQSKSTSSFPLDLISEILLRLPGKSVVRFRSVSKLWSPITTDPYFIKSFGTQSSTRPSFLLFLKKMGKCFVFSIPQHHPKNWNSSFQPNDCYHMKLPEEYSYLSPTESVHGLICFHESGTPIVWNPVMRQFLTLPKPRKSSKDITILLGYDPIEDKHKVVCLPRNRSCNGCRVLTLRSAQEAWRTVKTNHMHRSSSHTYGRCIKGVIYYIAYIYQTRVWVIMSFDVRYENFVIIALPSDICRDVLITYKGRLACVDTNYTKKNGITLWILVDEEKHKWSNQDFLAPFTHCDPRSRIISKLNGTTHAGEFVYVSTQFYTSFVLFYDPEKNRFTKVEFKGIIDDKLRLSNGSKNGRMYGVHTFPNHNECLISL